jgi:hypothetical protein
MAALHLITGLILALAGAGLVAVMQYRSGRLLRDGARVDGTVTAVRPGENSPYPPYAAAGPRIEVAYTHAGTAQTATIWLTASKESDYTIGQTVPLITSRYRPG